MGERKKERERERERDRDCARVLFSDTQSHPYTCICAIQYGCGLQKGALSFAKESAHGRASARARARERENGGRGGGDGARAHERERERARERKHAREREKARARARDRDRDRDREPGWRQPRLGENPQRHRPLWRKQRLAAPPPTRFWLPLVTPEVGLAPPGFRVWSLGFEHGVGFRLSVTPEVGLVLLDVRFRV